MSDRLRKDALLRIGEDALIDVGCCLDRFDVDSIQCLSWKSHTYLANKSHILPVRLLHTAHIGADGTSFLGRLLHTAHIAPVDISVSPRDHTHDSVRFDGTQQDALQLALAAIKESDLESLQFFDLSDGPMTEEEVGQVAAIAATVKVKDLRLCGRLTHLSPPVLHRFMFGFSYVEELTVRRINGNQLTDEHLRECRRKQIWRLCVNTEAADTGPLAFSDDALIDYLYAQGIPDKECPSVELTFRLLTPARSSSRSSSA